MNESSEGCSTCCTRCFRCVSSEFCLCSGRPAPRCAPFQSLFLPERNFRTNPCLGPSGLELLHLVHVQQTSSSMHERPNMTRQAATHHYMTRQAATHHYKPHFNLVVDITTISCRHLFDSCASDATPDHAATCSTGGQNLAYRCFPCSRRLR